MKLTEANVSKIALDMIELKGNSYEIINLLHQISGKLDTIIALRKVESTHQPQQQ